MAEEPKSRGRPPAEAARERALAPARRDSTEAVRQLEAMLDRLDCPVGASATGRLLELVGAGGGEPASTVAVISQDVCLAGRLLSLSQGAGGEGAASLEQIIDALAPAGLRAAALGLKTFQEPRLANGALDYAQFCRHSLAVACAAEMMAQRSGVGIEPGLAFVCGLLHDLGKIALAECLPKSYQRVLAAAGGGGDLARAEAQAIGIDHTVAGRRLARCWRLPAAVEEVLWLHHQPAATLATGKGNAGLIAVVQLADLLARRRQLGFSGNFSRAPGAEGLAEVIGLPDKDVAAIEEELPARLERRLLPPAEAGYAPAVAQAAGDLARRNEQMARQVAVLERQSRWLGKLQDFIARVSPATAPATLIGEVAELFAAAGGATELPTAAFALIDETHAAVAVRAAGKTSFALVPRAGKTRLGDSKVLPGASVLGLLEYPTNWPATLELERHVLLPLAAGGRCVGGVLLPCAEEAAQAAEIAEVLAPTAAFVLAGAMARALADRTAEDLAGALRRLGEADDALAEARTLAAIGEVAAGAAHEINNPLAVISGRAQLLAEQTTNSEERRSAELIVRKAQEISDIATELMAFARPPAPRPGPADMRATLERAKSQFLAQAKTPPAAVDIKVEPACPAANVDAEQIVEVLTELVRNAVTVGGAGVRIGMEARFGPDPGCVRVRVVDDGPGMDQATAASAFTPFFSHRTAGRGRGMGLARARRTVGANGGRMWIDSSPGGGTTVWLELPRA